MREESKTIEAMKQVLEALEYYRSGEDYQPTPASKAIPALRTAIAEASMQRLTDVQQEMEREPYGYFQYSPQLDAWVLNRDSNKGVAFYTHPPRREWVGLTEEERLLLIAYEPHPMMNRMALVHATEAKLKEKNS